MRGSFLAVLLAITCVPAADAQGVTCGPMGPHAKAELAYVRRIVSGTSSGAVAVRATLKLPALDSLAVQLVTNDSVCTVAANALRQTMNRLDLPLSRTWVIQVGPTRYWVYDPRFKSAIDVIEAVFDDTWTNLSLVTG